MLFKTITKSNFKKFVNHIIKENQTIGPVETDRNAKGEPVYQFEEINNFNEMAIDYTITYSSVKNFFLPFKENLSTFHFKDGTWNQKIDEPWYSTRHYRNSCR